MIFFLAEPYNIFIVSIRLKWKYDRSTLSERQAPENSVQSIFTAYHRLVTWEVSLTMNILRLNSLSNKDPSTIDAEKMRARFLPPSTMLATPKPPPLRHLLCDSHKAMMIHNSFNPDINIFWDIQNFPIKRQPGKSDNQVTAILTNRELFIERNAPPLQGLVAFVDTKYEYLKSQTQRGKAPLCPLSVIDRFLSKLRANPTRPRHQIC